MQMTCKKKEKEKKECRYSKRSHSTLCFSLLSLAKWVKKENNI